MPVGAGFKPALVQQTWAVTCAPIVEQDADLTWYEMLCREKGRVWNPPLQVQSSSSGFPQECLRASTAQVLRQLI